MCNNNSINKWDYLGLRIKLSAAQCECAYNRALNILKKLTSDHPPEKADNIMRSGVANIRYIIYKEARHDCDWGSTQLTKIIAR